VTNHQKVMGTKIGGPK